MYSRGCGCYGYGGKEATHHGEVRQPVGLLSTCHQRQRGGVAAAGGGTTMTGAGVASVTVDRAHGFFEDEDTGGGRALPKPRGQGVRVHVHVQKTQRCRGGGGGGRCVVLSPVPLRTGGSGFDSGGGGGFDGEFEFYGAWQGDGKRAQVQHASDSAVRAHTPQHRAL